MPDDWDDIPTNPEVRTNDQEQAIIDAWMALGRVRTTRRDLSPMRSATEYCIVWGKDK